MTLKAVVFDYGGVITRGGRSADGLNEALGVDRKRLKSLGPLNKFHALAQNFKLGKISDEEFFSGLRKNYKLPLPPNVGTLFRAYAKRRMRPHPAMLQLVQDLQAAGYATPLLSNVFGPSAEVFEQQGYYAPFTPRILSCKVGLAKPDPAIYQLLLRESGLKADEIVYVDDQERCLVPARALGMQTIRAETPAQVRTDLKQLGIKI